MKVIIVIFAVIAVTFANEKFRQECISELNIQPETIEKFKKGEYDDATPCFTECVFKKMGVFSNGQFNTEILMAMLNSDTMTPEELRTNIDNCIQTTETDDCQKAFKGFKCMKQKGIYKTPRRS